MQKVPVVKIIPVKCDGRIVAQLHFRDKAILIENKTSRRVAKLVPPSGMVFSAPKVFTIYIQPSDSITSSLRAAGIVPSAEAQQWKSTKEMAAEYRESAAKLAIYIRYRKSLGASDLELKTLRSALKEVRATGNLLDGYYEVPRSESSGAAVGWTARKINDSKYGS